MGSVLACLCVSFQSRPQKIGDLFHICKVSQNLPATNTDSHPWHKDCSVFSKGCSQLLLGPPYSPYPVFWAFLSPDRLLLGALQGPRICLWSAITGFILLIHGTGTAGSISTLVINSWCVSFRQNPPFGVPWGPKRLVFGVLQGPSTCYCSSWAPKTGFTYSHPWHRDHGLLFPKDESLPSASA